MGTFIWLLLTTIVGGFIGQVVPDVPHPVIGAVVGFIVGLILRVMVASGGAGEAMDGIGDVFDAFD